MLDLSCQRETRQYFGKYAGVVMPYDDVPADAKKRGDIRVQVPGILEEDNDGNPQPLDVIAKPCFQSRSFFLPEPDERVWVEFVAGDIDHPIWTGVWYPNEHKLTALAGEPPTRFQRVIHTPMGHVVQLDDTEGEEKVVIKHKTDSFVSIDKDGTIVVGNHKGSTVVLDAKAENVVIVDQHKNSVRMTSDGVGIVNLDGTAALFLTKDMVRVSAKTIVLDGAEVSLGKGAAAATIMADQAFITLWTAFAAHVHATGTGPSGPPTPPPPTLAPGSFLTSAARVS